MHQRHTCRTFFALFAALGCVASYADAALFTSGDIAVYRVGTGSGAPSSASTGVFIDEYTSGGTRVQSIALPTVASAGINALTGSGSAVRIGTVGSGAPIVAGQTISNLPGISASTGSPYAFALVHLGTTAVGWNT